MWSWESGRWYFKGTDGGRGGGGGLASPFAGKLVEPAETGLYGPSSGAGLNGGPTEGGGCSSAEDEGDGVRGGPAVSSIRGGSRIGGESRPMQSGDGFDIGVLKRRGIFGPGLLPPTFEGERFFGAGSGGGGGGSPWPMPLSGLVLQLVAESPPRGDAPSVLRRLLSSSVEAKDMSLSKPLLILSCHLSTLSSSSASAIEPQHIMKEAVHLHAGCFQLRIPRAVRSWMLASNTTSPCTKLIEQAAHLVHPSAPCPHITHVTFNFSILTYRMYYHHKKLTNHFQVKNNRAGSPVTYNFHFSNIYISVLEFYNMMY